MSSASVILSGWLEKRGDYGIMWKRRFFILRSNRRLSFYEESCPQRPEGVVHLAQVQRVERYRGSTAHPHSLVLVMSNEDNTQVVVSAESEEVMLEWEKFLNAGLMEECAVLECISPAKHAGFCDFHQGADHQPIPHSSSSSDAGAEMHRDPRRELCFREAAAEGKIHRCKELFARGGIHPDSTTNQQRTALMLASGNGHVSTMKFLLSIGADPKRSDKHGLSALHFAVKSSHAQACRVLAGVGADIHLKDAKEGLSPMNLAMDNPDCLEAIALGLSDYEKHATHSRTPSSNATPSSPLSPAVPTSSSVSHLKLGGRGASRYSIPETLNTLVDMVQSLTLTVESLQTEVSHLRNELSSRKSSVKSEDIFPAV